MERGRYYQQEQGAERMIRHNNKSLFLAELALCTLIAACDAPTALHDAADAGMESDVGSSNTYESVPMCHLHLGIATALRICQGRHDEQVDACDDDACFDQAWEMQGVCLQDEVFIWADCTMPHNPHIGGHDTDNDTYTDVSEVWGMSDPCDPMLYPCQAWWGL